MPEERIVKIVAWPEEPAKVEHRFNSEKPCPVSIAFEKTPANVIVHSNPKEPLHVDMAMNVIAKETIPVCIKMCEPICVKSKYAIAIDIFDRPVANIVLQGETRISNCREGDDNVRPLCVDFDKLKKGMEFTEALTHQEFKFTPLGEKLRTVDFGDPAGRIKLAFSGEGIRIDLPQEAGQVKLTVNNYAGQTLDFFVYTGSTLANQFSQDIVNEVKEIFISRSGVTAIEIKGGNNEAAVVEVCFSS